MARQLRLALSMNGGVSLAVWIGGAVAEIDQLRRGEGFWGDLLESCGYERKAQVDVLAGASAGGLNGVLLAQAIRTNTPFDDFLGLWCDHADIDQLVKFRGEVRFGDDRSLLRGEYFRQQLFEALPGDPAGDGGIVHDLQLLASATLLVGDRETYRDVQGAPLLDTRSGAYFTVARRGSATRGLDGFAVSDNREALAMMGRATSSLPAGFEPVRFDSGAAKSRLAQAFSPLRRDVEVIDGGVLDNVPIARAIKAIASSRAKGSTRRVLVYLHPDPAPASAANTDIPDRAIKVVRRFLGKRKESLREDIDELRAHNLAVQQQRSMMLRQIERLLAGSFTAEAAERPSRAIDQLQRQSAAALLMRCAVAPDAELTWHSPTEVRLASMVDRDDGIAIAELRDAVDAAVAADPQLLPAHRTARLVRALRWLVHDAESDARLDLGTAKALLYDLELLCDLALSYQLGNFAMGTTPSMAVAGVEQTARTLKALKVDNTHRWWSGLATWQPADGDGDPLPTCLNDRLNAILAKVNELVGNATGDHANKEDSASVRVLRAVSSEAISPGELDLAFAPLAVGRVVSSQPIDFVRVAGNAMSPAAKEFEAAGRKGNPKIAGTQLGHLGAFFHRDWRTNDWWWGRLDAVPAIAAAILDDQARKAHADRTGSNPTDPDLVAGIVRARQVELLALYRSQQQRPSGDRQPTTGNAAQQSPHDPMSEHWFKDWAQADRRVASLLGTAAITRTGLRAVVVATKLLIRRPAVRALLLPLVLAITGVILAGRRATVATAWTLCVLAAPRVDNTFWRWVVWSVGPLASAGIALLTEIKVKPTRQRWWWRQYVWAAAAVALGLWVLINHGRFVEGELPVFDELRMMWVLPALAAGVSAAMLFFWMPKTWRAAAIVFIALLYGIGARLDTWAADHPSHRVASMWPIHSLWVYWVVLVIAVPSIVAVCDRTFLRRTDSASKTQPAPRTGLGARMASRTSP